MTTDTERLDFLIENEFFLTCSYGKYQLWSICEDDWNREDGGGSYDVARDAIDSAMPKPNETMNFCPPLEQPVVGEMIQSAIMDDRDLIELSAKAMGFSYWQSKHGYLNVTDSNGITHVCCEYWTPYDSISGSPNTPPRLYDALDEIGWNPLIDKSQVFDIALKLRIGISFEFEIGYVVAGNNRIGLFKENLHPDKESAICRAIVNAAASLEQKK